MLRMRLLYLPAMIAANLAAASPAQEVGPVGPPAPTTHAELMRQRPPVTDADVTDRPYRILRVVRAHARMLTVFDDMRTREDVFRELWERGERLGADAVINARTFEERVTEVGVNVWRGNGQAVRFLTDAEIARGQTGERRLPPTYLAPHHDDNGN